MLQRTLINLQNSCSLSATLEVTSWNVHGFCFWHGLHIHGSMPNQIKLFQLSFLKMISSIEKVKEAPLNTTYPSLSNTAAGVQGRIWSLNLPRCWGDGLNCVFKYCLISFGDAQCGMVPSLYWSRAAAMWALSSFSELQITTRDNPTRESLPLNETRIQNYGQHLEKEKETKPNQTQRLYRRPQIFQSWKIVSILPVRWTDH